MPWNVEQAGIDASKRPWSALSRHVRSKQKPKAEEIQAAWDILCLHSGGSSDTAKLINGDDVHEMPDAGVPYTYVYNARSSSKRTRESYITLKQQGGGTFYPIKEHGLDDSDGCAQGIQNSMLPDACLCCCCKKSA